MLIILQRFGRYFFKKRIPFLPKAVDGIIRVFFRCAIFSETDIGVGTKFGYGGIALVIHRRTVIGKNCSIGPRVTIGGRSGYVNVPVIGDNCRVHSGAAILGPIVIGNNVVVGANAVVIHDIPDNSVVVGVPARIIGKEV